MNISISGVAIRTEAQTPIPENGTVLALIELNGEKHHINLKIVRKSTNTAAFTYSGNSQVIRAALFRSYQPELLAGTMYKVGEEKITETINGSPNWYTGENGSELFYVLSANQITKMHFSLLGYYFELLSETNKLRLGIEDISQIMSTKLEEIESKIIWETIIPEDIKLLATKFITSIPKLPKLHTKLILEIIAT